MTTTVRRHASPNDPCTRRCGRRASLYFDGRCAACAQADYDAKYGPDDAFRLRNQPPDDTQSLDPDPDPDDDQAHHRWEQVHEARIDRFFCGDDDQPKHELHREDEDEL